MFPARSLVLTVPTMPTLVAGQVSVAENGKPVGPTVVTPIASAAAKDFGIVLAIDVSPSMSGATLQDAMAAARTLARRRTGAQQLGIVEFDQEARPILPLTTDPSAIARALAGTPAVGPGTHIYDALSLALNELQSQQVAAGAVILISDGADRGSIHSETEVANAARARHIALYTVGVRDSAFQSQSLEALARDGRGQYLETRSSHLGQVLAGLSKELTSRYVIHYRSTQPPGSSVEVRVVVQGLPGVAVAHYIVPGFERAARHTAGHPFWRTTLALVLSAFGAALLLGIALAVYLMPRVQQAALRERVAVFTATPEPLVAAIEGAAHRPNAMDRMLSGTGWWDRLKFDLEIGRLERPAHQLLATWAAIALALAVVVAIVVGPLLALIPLVAVPLAFRSWIRLHVRKQRELFSEQLPHHLQELASAMRAGHSLVAGINAMASSAEEPSKHEWTRVVADEQLGMPLETAMVPLGERMGSSDIDQVAVVAALHSRTGGNMAEVIERLADGVRERSDLRRELEALTAQARLSRWVVSALPPVVGGIIYLINPGYMRPLLHTHTGQLMLLVAAALVAAGFVVMRRLTDIKT